MTGLVTIVERRMPHVEQELALHIFPGYQRLSTVFSRVRVARSSVFCVMFCIMLITFFF